MARLSILAALLAVASFTSAQTVKHAPCNKIRQLITNGDPIEAAVAYGCLTSVPFKKDVGKAVVENFKKWTQLHSTVGDLKNPGEGYPNEAVDLNALLDEMITRIDAGEFKNEYAFEEALALISFKSYDGHYGFRGPTFGVFDWIRGGFPPSSSQSGVFPGALISVSESVKGLTLPRVYFHSDLTDPSDVTAIVKINDIDVVEYLEKEMLHQLYHDPDARWNTLFAREQADSPGAFVFPFTYPGENFTAEHEDGSTTTVRTFAQISDAEHRGKWYNVVDGDSFYEQFVKPKTAAKAASGDEPLIGERSTNDAVQARALPKSGRRDPAAPKLKKRYMPANYPTPEITHDEEAIGGFFLDDHKGLEDVAVLAFNTFSAEDRSDHLAFQDLVEQFIDYCQKKKKTKIIIDVSSNGGGTLFFAYDIFKQFFPEIEPDLGVRYAATPAIDILGEQIGSISEADADLKTLYAKGYTSSNLYNSPMHWSSNVDKDLKQFTSWKEMAGPVTLNGNPYTELMRYNLTYENLGHGGLEDISGYGTRKDMGPQPFKAEDIVLIHDGYCASTCSIFTDLMRRQGGVRSIALGGRPQFGPMQSVGGTKGAILFSWSVVSAWIESVTTFFGTEAERAAWKKVLPGDWAIDMSAHPPPVNGRNAYQPGSATPIQFLNETAECRLFYTASMLEDITAIWDTVARVAWGIEGGSGQTCVPGSVTDGKPIGNVALDVTTASVPKIPGTSGAKAAAEGDAVSKGAVGAAVSGRAVTWVSAVSALVVAGVFAGL